MRRWRKRPVRKRRAVKDRAGRGLVLVLDGRGGGGGKRGRTDDAAEEQGDLAAAEEKAAHLGDIDMKFLRDGRWRIVTLGMFT